MNAGGMNAIGLTGPRKSTQKRGSSSEGVETGSGGVEIFSAGASSAGVAKKIVLP